jgi:hypothetical protein
MNKSFLGLFETQKARHFQPGFFFYALRVREEITLHFLGVEAPAWQDARRANSVLFNRRVTQPGGMDRRIKM